MDGLKIFLFALILISPLSHSSEVEYISPEKQKELESIFDKATFSAKSDASKLKDHAWTCEMFGMRTRMQVQRGLKLYEWKASDSSEWHNDGAQLVSDYKSGSSSLVGRRDRFEDQVKLTKDGQLVSRLTLAASPTTVLAYSVCKTL